jgi:hypothetical protein
MDESFMAEHLHSQQTGCSTLNTEETGVVRHGGS